MRSPLVMLFALLALALPALAVADRSSSKAEPRLAHMVFFSLKDHSADSVDKFLSSCDKYLSGHAGTVSYSVGRIARDVVEPVSDRDFDVALHLVFENKDAAAAYQKSELHSRFVEENKAGFARVRVFDSYLASEKK